MELGIKIQHPLTDCVFRLLEEVEQETPLTTLNLYLDQSIKGKRATSTSCDMLTLYPGLYAAITGSCLR
jgi:hypothetical protein